MKKNTHHRHVCSYLNGEQDTSDILKHAEHLKSLQDVVLKCLPESIRTRCQLVNYRAGVLTLAAEQSSISSRIRYSSPDILKNLNQAASQLDIKTIRVITTPSASSDHQKKAEKPVMSKQTVNVINSAAKLIGDQELSRCLERLASHGNDS